MLTSMLTIAGGIVLAVFIIGFLSQALYSKTFWLLAVMALIGVLAFFNQVVPAAIGFIGLAAAYFYHVRKRRGLLRDKGPR